MKRMDVIREIAGRSGLVVCNIGFPSRELYAVCDRSEHFYMLGSMGLASSIGLGLALSCSETVYVIDGDGSILMNLGSLVTIAHHGPANLCLVVIDNHVYGSTGSQPTYTGRQADLAAIARGCGNRHVERVLSPTELRDALDRNAQQCRVVIAETDPGNEQVPLIPLTPTGIRQRFMAGLRASVVQKKRAKKT